MIMALNQITYLLTYLQNYAGSGIKYSVLTDGVTVLITWQLVKLLLRLARDLFVLFAQDAWSVAQVSRR